MNFGDNIRQNPSRRGQLWFITVPHTRVSKLHAFNSLEDFCLRLVITQESHYDDTPHHHIFMKTVVTQAVYEIEDMIRTIYDLDPDHPNADLFHIAIVKNQDHVIKYICKEDWRPMCKGVLDRHLSFVSRAVRWALRTPVFKHYDPFVLGHPQWYKLLKCLHTDVRSKIEERGTRELRKYIIQEGEQLTSWQLKVVQFWNDWVENGFHPKKRQLYLWGPSNTFKTSFIHNLLSRTINLPEDEEDDYERFVFTPVPNDPKFAYQGFESQLHKVVVGDEFHFPEYNINDFKRFVAGETVVVNRKGQASKKIKAKMPMIFISNHPPPTDDTSHNYAGVMNRLLVVSTDPLYENQQTEIELPMNIDLELPMNIE